MGISEREQKETEEVFKTVIMDNFPQLMSDIKSQIQ